MILKTAMTKREREDTTSIIMAGTGVGAAITGLEEYKIGKSGLARADELAPKLKRYQKDYDSINRQLTQQKEINSTMVKAKDNAIRTSKKLKTKPNIDRITRRISESSDKIKQLTPKFNSSSRLFNAVKDAHSSALSSGRFSTRLGKVMGVAGIGLAGLGLGKMYYDSKKSTKKNK